jgi:hypothetical protein
VLHHIGEEPSRRRQHHPTIFEAHLWYLLAADLACIRRGIDARR